MNTVRNFFPFSAEKKEKKKEIPLEFGDGGELFLVRPSFFLLPENQAIFSAG